jgi:hypothetical protein
MVNISFPPLPKHKQRTPSDSPSEVQTHVDVFRSSVVPLPQRRATRRLLTYFIIVVLLVIIGVGGYWQFFSTKASPTTYKALAPTVANKPSASSTEHKTEPKLASHAYTASDFNLSFNYPNGWTVFNNGSGPMTVTSPTMELTSATGQKVKGLVIMTIQQQGQLPTSLSAGTALAVLNSQIMTYTRPTSSQSSQAYLSFIQYYSTNTKGGLDGIYLTGNYGYQKDQVIPDSDIDTINPLVTITFTKCGHASCSSNLTPLTIASTSWSNTQLQLPIKTMLSSLAFQ